MRTNCLRMARGAPATFGTGMKLLDESAETGIGLPRILRIGSVHKLVAVVVHLHSAARTNHLVSIGHISRPCLLRSVQKYLLTTLTQRFRHPNEFVQKLINAPDVGLIKESPILGKHFLHTREIYIPENRNQPELTHYR
jgi:hypothetical protein